MKKYISLLISLFYNKCPPEIGTKPSDEYFVGVISQLFRNHPGIRISAYDVVWTTQNTIVDVARKSLPWALRNPPLKWIRKLFDKREEKTYVVTKNEIMHALNELMNREIISPANLSGPWEDTTYELAKRQYTLMR